MNLDVRSLRTFSRLAHSGAEKAAGSLTTLAGIDTYVNVTKVELGTKTDVEQEFAERDLVSVHIGFSGGLDGRTVLAFSPESAERLVDALMPGMDGAETGSELATSSLKEVANIMLGGFIDGWADYLDTTVDITTPTYVDDDSNSPLENLESDGFEHESDNEHILVFRNQLEAADDAIEFDLYMVPSPDSIKTITDASGQHGALPVQSFAAFSDMIADGADQASADITAMTGIDTTVEVSRMSFVPIEGVPMSLTDSVRRGVVLEFFGTPSGYIAILFDEPSADNIASSLLPGMEGDEAMRQSAIQEIGNIVTSGFLDGWANTLGTTIDISPPKHVHDIGSAIVDPLATELAQSQEYAFLIDSTIRTDDDEFTCDIYALPNEEELRKALEQLSPAV
ncbi:chemotaxis protein CheC, inhibitor of MCP methylation [Haloferax elongans ATCC BAA-1513]|uniref:Chemotaxis protein CheC, inhibitor of MCP methylation n=1 Tax=Haloferax elongans ATCC BAA-1513 TaxID=1230453 RepID=M0HPY6_HALEO|nr:chemotaxis protein CheC [Haloferax elongans]ELZ85818.1 chemotaxis protein CheC, inhibitor of MCP methylation [Haloferax elongans ATCC BAA-1513]